MSTIMRRNGMSDLVMLHETMDQLLDGALTRSGTRRFAPALDVSESGEAYHLELAVPGLRAEDLELTFEQGVLTIQGEVRREAPAGERTYHRVERTAGRFRRAVSLPGRVDAESIRATLRDGVLAIEVPKSADVKPRRIAVAVDASN
jgi:HSP20 family protein